VRIKKKVVLDLFLFLTLLISLIDIKLKYFPQVESVLAMMAIGK